MDELQRERLKIPFNTLDMPEEAFVTGGKTWKMIQAGQADPDQFGIFDMKGLAFISGDLIRDFLALNIIEILPGDAWRYISWLQVQDKDLPMLDRIAELTVGNGSTFPEVRELFEKDSHLEPDPMWKP